MKIQGILGDLEQKWNWYFPKFWEGGLRDGGVYGEVYGIREN